MRPSRHFRRSELKKFYFDRKKEDRNIGLKINVLMRELLSEVSRAVKGNDKSEETKKIVEGLVKEIKELRQLGRLKNEFPSLSTLKKYLKKENISLQELKESIQK